MAEDSSIRRGNLVRIFKTPKAADAALGGKDGLAGYSYWAALMGDARKPFGEKMARKIEARMGWPRGALDEPEFAPANTGRPPPVDYRKQAEIVAMQIKDGKKREAILNFLRFVDHHIESGERISESIPDFL